MAILRRTERAIVRAMFGAKLMEKKRTEDQIEMLGLKETVLEFEVKGKKKQGRPKKT